MAGQGRTLLVLGCVLAAGIAAAVLAVMDSTPDADVEDAARPSSAGTRDGAAASQGPTAAPRRPKKTGTASVVGEVRRSKGHLPVADQQVQLVPEKGDPWSVTTDSAGAFLLADVPHGGPYELRVAAPGCGTIRIPGLALDRNEKREVGTLWLDPAVKVTVEVRGWSDQPVPGAAVEAYAVAQADNFDWSKAYAQMGQTPVPVAKASTDAKGVAVFPELATGRFTFTAGKEGYSRGGRSNVTVRADVEPVPVKLYLGTGHPLSGRVTDSAKAAVAGATVMTGSANSSWDLGAAPLRARATTDADGRYSFASLEAGDTGLWVGRPGGIPAIVATLRIPGVSKFDVTLKGTGSITGTVTAKEGGTPIEAAMVRAWTSGFGAGTVAEATTDAQGRYAISVPEGLVSQVVADKAGWVSGADPGRQPTPLQVREGETQSRDLTLRASSKVTGVVKGPAGPLAAAKVFVHAGPGGGWAQKSATTDAEGRYEVTSVAPGQAMVRVELAGWYVKDFPDNYWMLMQQPGPSPFKVDVPDAGVASKDVEMVRGVVVEGRVEGPDGPLEGVRVPSPQDREGGMLTDASGAFRLEGVKPSPNVYLIPMKDGFVPSTANKPVAVTADQPATGIVLRMTRTALVRGTITMADGSPLVDGKVSVSASMDRSDGMTMMEASGGFAGRGSSMGASTPVRPDGTYEAQLTVGAPGKFRVMASALDRPAANSDPVAVVDGQTEYVVNVTLESGKGLEGRVVVRQGGAPVPGALVTVQASGRGSSRSVMSMNGVVYSPDGSAQQTVWAVADADGHFAVGHLTPGTYSVGARADGYVAGAATVDLAATDKVTVELEPELAIEGVVTLVDGTPVAGANVNAQRDAPAGPGAKVEVAMQPANAAWTVSGSGGRFRIPGLAAGTYKLRVGADWQGEVNIKTKTTDPIRAGANDVKVVVEAGGVIAGRVLDPQRKGMGNVGVNANPEVKEGGKPLEGVEGRSVRTKEDGSFTLAGLGDATFSVSVQLNQPWESNSGSAYRSATVKGVAVGTTNLEIVLEEGLTITGVLVNSDGKPMPSSGLSCKGATRDPKQPYENPRNGMTDPNGAFTFIGLSAGDWTITLQDQQLVIENGDKVPAGARDVRLIATRGIVLSGSVVDETGAPLRNVSVGAGPKGGGRGRGGRVKDDGTFEISGLSAAPSYTVTVNAPGRPVAKLDDVPPGATGLRLSLMKGVEVSGKALDEGGGPLRQSRLTFRLQGDNDQRAMAITDAEGNFKASGLLEGGTYEADVMVTVAGANNTMTTSAKKCGTFKAGPGAVELRVVP